MGCSTGLGPGAFRAGRGDGKQLAGADTEPGRFRQGQEQAAMGTERPIELPALPLTGAGGMGDNQLIQSGR